MKHYIFRKSRLEHRELIMIDKVRLIKRNIFSLIIEVTLPNVFMIFPFFQQLLLRILKLLTNALSLQSEIISAVCKELRRDPL